MSGADSPIDVAFHPLMGVPAKISAQNIGVVGSDKLAAEFFHANRRLGVALGTNEVHAFRKNRDV